jgi:hypothetical protein
VAALVVVPAEVVPVAALAAVPVVVPAVPLVVGPLVARGVVVATAKSSSPWISRRTPRTTRRCPMA